MNQLLQIYHSETLCLLCEDSKPTYFAERHRYYHLEVHPSFLFSEKFCSVFQGYYYLGKLPLEMFFVTIILKYTAFCAEHSCLEYALATALIFSKFDIPDTDTSFAACFTASDVSHSAFEKYAHMYITAL